ncbi:hypothetical protein [Xenorhabdus szentirmaii]|nr:hypothetical protein [Xenorhabdus sp. 38]MBD2779063.1 hypothetical protein [Xenorhabdus sp. 38]
MFSKEEDDIIYVNKDNVNYSPDGGKSWQNKLNIKSVMSKHNADSMYDDQYLFAIEGSEVLIWQTPNSNRVSLEIKMNYKTSKVLKVKWLPFRVNEAVQGMDGELFLLTQDLSRGLNDLRRYSFDGESEILLETGYRDLHYLQIGVEHLIVQHGKYDRQISVIMDKQGKNIRYKQKMETETKRTTFDPVQERFIHFETDYEGLNHKKLLYTDVTP